ncbi:myosin-2 heavy chain-like [Euwallacea similis]|uniref:myosin-2 heavy chain-like n=1 Tax=Euwallacea similis TaxID=1736056 RepID=UPI00344C6C0A
MSVFYQKGSSQDAFCAEQMKIPTGALAQLEETENVVEGGDDLHWELESCRCELEEFEIRLEMGLGKWAKTGKKRLAAHGPFKEGETSAGNSCDEEVTSLEEEITRMRTETPEKESRITAREMEVLSKYCSKLSSIQEENAKLEKTNQELQLRCMESEEKLQILGCDVDHSTLETLKEKLLTLKEPTAERDELWTQLQQLERKLNDHHDVPEGTEGFNRRSVLLDDVLEDLRAGKMEQSPALDEQLVQFKQKADRVDELERLLRLAAKDVQLAEDELDSTQTKCAMAEIEALNRRTETETLKSKIVCMEHEMESLKSMCKVQEELRREKDRLQVSLDELVRMQDDYEDMQMKAVDVIKAERDRYKRKCEQLIGLESQCILQKTQLDRAKLIEQEKDSLQKQAEDLETYVCKQEAEIKSLVCHINCLAQGEEQQQVKMKEEVSSLKLELEEKKSQLAISKEEIATLNMKIETSICNLTNEAVQLRHDKENLRKSLKRITQEKLEIKHQYQELEEINYDLKRELQSKLKQIQDQETQLSDKNRAIETMQEVLNDRENIQNNQITEYSDWESARLQVELGKENTENQQLPLEARTTSEANDQFKDMLEQAKCAIKCIAQELEQQYAEWDSHKERFRCCPGCNGKESTAQNEVIISEKKPEVQSKEVQCSYQPTCNCKKTMQPKLQDSTSQYTPTKQISRGSQGLDLKLPNNFKEDVEEDAMFTARSVEDSLAKLAELKAELLKANEAIESLRQQLAEAEKTAAENFTLKKHLNKTLDDMKKVGTEGSAALLSMENSKLKKDPENALENVRNSCNEASCLKAENSKLKQWLEQLGTESAKLKFDMGLAWDFLKKISDESKQLQDNNKQYKQKNGELEDEITELQRRLDLTVKPIKVADTNVKLLQEELNNLRKDLDATRNEASASGQGNLQLCSGNIDMETALKAKAAAATQINHLKSTVKTLKNQMVQMGKSNKGLQMEKSALPENMKRSTTDLEVKKDRGKHRTRSKEMEKKYSYLKSLILILAQEVVKERKKSLKLQKERDEIREQLRVSVTKMKSLERRATTLIEDNEETVKGKLKAVEEDDKLRKERVDLEDQMKEVKGKSETLQSQVRAIDEELTEKRRSNFEDSKLQNEKLTLATFETTSSPLVHLTLSSPFSDDELVSHDKKLRTGNLADLVKKGSTKGFRLPLRMAITTLIFAVLHNSQALTMRELQFVHKHLNEAAAKALEYLDQKAGVLRPREGRDRLFFLQKIADLEGDLLRRQRQASEKIAQGQNGVKLKDCRSRELKRDLEREKEQTPVAPVKASRRRISGNVNALELKKRLNEELLNKMKLKEKPKRPERPRRKLAAVRDANVLKRNAYQAPHSARFP